MKITDKMIEDLICDQCDSYRMGVVTRGVNCSEYSTCKNSIKQKGYEVEEPKSKLEEAGDYYNNLCHDNVSKYQITALKDLYEQVIEEIIADYENCNNCDYNKTIKKLEETINKMKNCYNCNFGSYDICPKRNYVDYNPENCNKWELRE